MNSLQISLIVLAIVAVVAVLVYNWLQDRKYRKQWTATFGQQDDVLLKHGERRIDPVVRETEIPDSRNDFPEIVAERPAPIIEPPERRVPESHDETGEMLDADPGIAAEDQRSPDEIAEKPGVAELPPAPVDTELEFIIEIHAADAMPSSAFIKLMESQRAEGRAVRWLGYANNSSSWIEISPWREQEFYDVTIALQLADRSGAVSERQLIALGQEARALAEQFKGVANWRDIGSVLANAKELDQFCVEVDVLIGLNVVSPDGVTFNGAKIAEMAEADKMILNDAGVYQRYNERGDVIYSLCNHEDTPFSAEYMSTLATHGITLLFEVPRVDNGVEMFAAMARFGFQLAKTLDGKLVDDNIRTLSAAGIEKIQTQLTEIYHRMDARGIPAGGQRALRLFN
ncbi:MAG TPA: cell division protein ZipA C-terminal FtsZ-binding domain-containing protein [Burkholderiales bacterium]|nr:cell division protein ZipA C-terminal FtsZ-binding domain-containing protein [Burkholderiales bacterium]